MDKVGKKVKIMLKDREYSGILISEKPSVVLKLSNGYNVSFDRRKVLKIKEIGRPIRKFPAKLKLKFNKKLPKVAILSTGGTISSKVDYVTGGVSPA